MDSQCQQVVLPSVVHLPATVTAFVKVTWSRCQRNH